MGCTESMRQVPATARNLSKRSTESNWQVGEVQSLSKYAADDASERRFVRVLVPGMTDEGHLEQEFTNSTGVPTLTSRSSQSAQSSRGPKTTEACVGQSPFLESESTGTRSIESARCVTLLSSHNSGTPNPKQASRRRDPDGSWTVNFTVEDANFRVRCQLYRQLFHVLDTNCSGHLDITEIEKFAAWLLCDEWSPQLCADFFTKADQDFNGLITLIEFIEFVECTLKPMVCEPDVTDYEVTERLKHMMGNFMEMVALHQKNVAALWKFRASLVDKWSRYIFCGSFTVALIILCSVELRPTF